MTTREATKTYKLNQWTQIIRECRNSGQKVQDWCKDNNIDPKKYYYWLSQVRKAATQALPATLKDSSIIPINLQKENSVVPTPSQIVSSNDIVATISVGNVIVQLSNHASSDFILNVMKAMQHVR